MTELNWCVYTSSDEAGLTGNIGYDFQAASPGLLTGQLRAFEPLLGYAPPPNAQLSTLTQQVAPRSLVRVKVADQCLIAEKRFLEQDRVGRRGVFHTYGLVGSASVLSAQQALDLWDSNFWVEAMRRSTGKRSLPVLHLADLESRGSLTREALPQALRKQGFIRSLRWLLTQWLGGACRLLIVAPPAEVALMLFGLVEAVPPVLTADLTFSTYEAAVEEWLQRCTVVGTCPAPPEATLPGSGHFQLGATCRLAADAVYDSFSREASDPPPGAKRFERLVSFLLAELGGDRNRLEQFLEDATPWGVSSREDLLELFEETIERRGSIVLDQPSIRLLRLPRVTSEVLRNSDDRATLITHAFASPERWQKLVFPAICSAIDRRSPLLHYLLRGIISHANELVNRAGIRDEHLAVVRDAVRRSDSTEPGLPEAKRLAADLRSRAPAMLLTLADVFPAEAAELRREQEAERRREEEHARSLVDSPSPRSNLLNRRVERRDQHPLQAALRTLREQSWPSLDEIATFRQLLFRGAPEAKEMLMREMFAQVDSSRALEEAFWQYSWISSSPVRLLQTVATLPDPPLELASAAIALACDSQASLWQAGQPRPTKIERLASVEPLVTGEVAFEIEYVLADEWSWLARRNWTRLYRRCRYLDPTVRINLNSTADRSDQPSPDSADSEAGPTELVVFAPLLTSCHPSEQGDLSAEDKALLTNYIERIQTLWPEGGPRTLKVRVGSCDPRAEARLKAAIHNMLFRRFPQLVGALSEPTAIADGRQMTLYVDLLPPKELSSSDGPLYPSTRAF